MDNVEVITKITYIYFVYLVLALLVERLLEVAVAAFNYSEFKLEWYRTWDRKAKKYQERLDRLYGYQGEGASATQKLFSRLLWKVVSERPYEGGKEVISANLIRLNYIRVGSRVVSFLLSLALVVALQLDFIDIVEKAVPEVKRWLQFIIKYEWVRMVLTAVAISIGTDPLHQIIRQLEKAAEGKAKTAAGGAR